MYKLFKDIKSDDNMERIEALRLRNKIQSVFFNTDEIIRAEYQIINISKEDSNNEIINSNIPNFEFNYLKFPKYIKYLFFYFILTFNQKIDKFKLF